MSRCNLQHLTHTGRSFMTKVEVIPYQEHEGIVSGEFVGTPYRVAITTGSTLLKKGESLSVLPRSMQEGLPGSRVDNDRRRLNPRGEEVIQDYRQRRLGHPFRVNQRLERQVVLGRTGGSNDGFAGNHGKRVRVRRLE